MNAVRWVVVVALGAQACGARSETRAAGEPRLPTGEVIQSKNSAVASTADRPWDDALGAVIALPASASAGSMLLIRDESNGADVDVELFTHDDRVLRASMRPGAALGCGWARAVTLQNAAPGTNTSWALALAPGVALPMAVDAIGDLTPRDSSELAARVSRLVNALSGDSTIAPFRGLPVVVRDAWTATLPDGTPVVVAVAMRSLNVESNPRAEIITVVAEPESPVPGAAWRSAFTRRDAGPEDRVEGADLLSAVLLGGKVPVLAMLRETEHGPAVDFIERVSPAAWRLRWTTASLPCAP